MQRTEIIERGYGKTFYFHDPNGIRLQIELKIKQDADSLEGDPDPVRMCAHCCRRLRVLPTVPLWRRYPTRTGRTEILDRRAGEALVAATTRASNLGQGYSGTVLCGLRTL